MKTIALRFADTFAPPMGTIAAHKEVITKGGYVWYGKLGNTIAKKIKQDILNNEEPRILLIHSGKSGRYWAYVDDIIFEEPDSYHIPSYYQGRVKDFHTWFRVTRIEQAEKGVLSKCTVLSSNKKLTDASRDSMSPYFIIRY